MKVLYYGGTIITMERPEDAPEAVLTDSQSGRIAAVGTLEEVEKLADETTERVDSVSYTHLDVYKRQVIKLVKCIK